MLNVVVVGAFGKMGREVVKAVGAAPNLTVAAVVDVAAGDAGEARTLGVSGDVLISDSLEDALAFKKSQVMVDFTTPDAVMDNIGMALERGVHAVVGTTGFSDDDRSSIERQCQKTGSNCLIAANFAIGAILMMQLSETASIHFDQVEIVERHHEKKADAPSGTAIQTAERIVAAGGPVQASPSAETVVGARGADVEGVTVHSIRLPGLSAHQEVVFGGPGQTLTIKHDVLDRSCYMPGVILAVRSVGELKGLTVGIDGILSSGNGAERGSGGKR